MCLGHWFMAAEGLGPLHEIFVAWAVEGLDYISF